MMMTKRCYAAILTAKDMSAKIKELTDEVREKGVTKAYKAVMQIAELNDKYFRDFQNINPAWTPDNPQPYYTAPAAQSAPAQNATANMPAPAPAYAYAEDEMPIQ